MKSTRTSSKQAWRFMALISASTIWVWYFIVTYTDILLPSKAGVASALTKLFMLVEFYFFPFDFANLGIHNCEDFMDTKKDKLLAWCIKCFVLSCSTVFLNALCVKAKLLPQRKLGMMLKTKCRITVNSLMVQLANATSLSWSSIQYNLLEVKHIEK